MGIRTTLDKGLLDVRFNIVNHHNTMDAKDVLLQRFTDFLLKNEVEVVRLCMVIQLRQMLLPLANKFHKTFVKKI